jgi:PucR C-terminal helix-turn-helix domain/GGDEF-like domain
VSGRVHHERTAESPAPTDAVQQLAHALAAHTEAIAATVSARVVEAVPETAPPEYEDSLEIVRLSTVHNVGAILSTLAYGMPATAGEPPLGTRTLYERTIESGADVTALLRAYRVGHQALWEIWCEHVAGEIDDDAGLLHEVLALSATHMFTYIDQVCERLVAEDRARRRAEPEVRRDSRAELLRRVLAGEPLALDAGSAALGYELRRHHVGVVATRVAPDGDPRRAVDALGRAAGTRPLALPAGDGAWWAWLGWAQEPGEEALDALLELAPGGVLAGLGEPGYGLAGFRRTHEQALDAERTARLARRPQAIVRHREVELAAVLCADSERARRLARERLGPLVADDASTRRLRETLRAFLATGGSVSRAAERLGVHQKTVSYRLRRVEELLGHPVAGHRAALEAALLIEATIDIR